MSTGNFEKPRWLRDLLRFLSLKSQFVLSGNIQDLHVHEISVGVLAAAPLQTSLAIELYQRGFEHVIACDVVRGVRVLSRKGASQFSSTVIESLGLAGIDQVPSAAESGPDDESSNRVCIPHGHCGYEFIHKGAAIGSVPRFKLVPRGSTALLDAVGRAINETGARLMEMEETLRPGLVVFVIVTDGAENSSKEFSRGQIREMIEHKQSVLKWQFSFLAANQDAFVEGATLGIDQTGIANFAAENIGVAYAATAKKMSRMRKAMSGGGPVDNKFTDEELKEMT